MRLGNYGHEHKRRFEFVNSRSITIEGPLVTIGIPTFNRSSMLLSGSLRSALAQTYANIDIIVSDNASDDNTQEVVDAVGKGKVRYIRNSINIGASANCLSLAENATGKYFVLLQDDDMIFPDYVRDAVESMEKQEDAVAYLAYVIHTKNPVMLNGHISFCGPPITLDWIASEAVTLPGDFITPASMFCSVAAPPSVMYRRSALSQQFYDAFFDPRYPIFGEAVGLSRLTFGKKVIAAPKLAAIHRVHEGQSNRGLFAATEEFSRSRAVAAATLDSIWGDRDLEQCIEFQRLVSELPDERFLTLFHPWVQVFDISPPNKLSRQVKLCLEREVRKRRGLDKLSGIGKLRRQVGIFAQDVAPPCLFRWVRKIMNSVLGENQ